jgi:hypothetical protein
MTPAERIATFMAATPGGVGVFNIARGVWDVQLEPALQGAALIVLAMFIYVVVLAFEPR